MRGSMLPADIEALHAMREAIVSAECRGDLSFFVATLDDDAVVMPPDAPAREGKTACLSFVRDVLHSMLAQFDLGEPLASRQFTAVEMRKALGR